VKTAGLTEAVRSYRLSLEGNGRLVNISLVCLSSLCPHCTSTDYSCNSQGDITHSRAGSERPRYGPLALAALISLLFGRVAVPLHPHVTCGDVSEQAFLRHTAHHASRAGSNDGHLPAHFGYAKPSHLHTTADQHLVNKHLSPLSVHMNLQCP
jgi:hypothetical protein